MHHASDPSSIDRELHHINPKGRPVKQCEHCRGARKSKSHHAKCDCGDKKDKDKLKDKGDAKGELTHDSDAHDNSDHLSVHDGRCQCHSGGKCLCGTTKEILDLKLDTSKQTLHDARVKPKLITTHSEPQLTVFANGHHKPCHRNNNTAHVSGAPYKIPRPHTLHGHSAFAALSQSGNNHSHKPEAPAARSMDTLSVSNNDFYTIFGSDQRSADDAGNIESTTFQEPLFANQNSVFGQDGNSPDSNGSDTFSSQQWPWATTTATPVNGLFNYGSLSTSPSQDCLPNLDSDWSIPSAGFNPIWSAGDLPLDPSKFNDSLTQPISHSGESKQSGPGLTAASSVHSELNEQNLFGDMEIKPPQSTASDTLFWEDSPVYRLGNSASGEGLMTPVSTLTVSVPQIQGLESDFTKGLNSIPTSMPSTSISDFTEATAITMPNHLEDNISIDPWPIEQSAATFGGGFTGFEMPYPATWF